MLSFETESWYKYYRKLALRLLPKLCLIVISVYLAACGASTPYYQNDGDQPKATSNKINADSTNFTLFFIGDTGAPLADPLEPSLQILQYQLNKAGEQSAVIFLGDNIYNNGLRPQGHPKRAQSERRINTQLQVFQNYKGKAIFIPGNHDWNNGRKNGLQAIQRQEAYIESAATGNAFFLPNNGCPGPVEVQLGSSSVLLILDTEWWLYGHQKPGLQECEPGSKETVVQAVDSLVTQHKDRQIFVVGHHPMYSNGNHGGYFSWKKHLFPLQEIHPALYVPLPGFGSILPLYRKTVGFHQDITGKQYRQLQEQLTRIFEQAPNLTYTSGHDHSMQYHHINDQHYIISGSGTVKDYVRRGKSAGFAYQHKGFARIDIWQHKTVLSFWIPDDNRPKGKVVFRKILYSQP